MLTDSELAEARDLQESLMVDAVRIDRLGEPVYDPKLKKTVAAQTEIYAGKARVGGPQGAGPVIISGELAYPSTTPVTVPWDVRPEEGDRVTITAVLNDPSLVGLVLWVTAVEGQTFATARRFHASRQR